MTAISQQKTADEILSGVYFIIDKMVICFIFILSVFF